MNRNQENANGRLVAGQSQVLSVAGLPSAIPKAPQFPSSCSDPRRFSDAVGALKRHGLLKSPVIIEALTLLATFPNHPEANRLLGSALARIRIHEAVNGTNPFETPPAGSLDGLMRLGCYINGNPANPVGLSMDEVAQGIIIPGMQGSGKSNLIKSLILHNLGNSAVRFSIFTKKRDERGLIHYNHPLIVLRPTDPFNHLDPMGCSPARHSMTTAGNFTFSNRLWLGPEAVLSQTIQRLSEKIGAPPTWVEVRGYIGAIRNNDRSMKEFLASLDIKLGYLIQVFGQALEYRRGFDLRLAMSANTVYELPLDCPAEVRRFHVLQIISSYFHLRRAWFATLTEEQIQSVPLLISVIDDGHEFFCEDQERAEHDAPPPFYEILTGARAYKLAFLIASHTPETLSKVLWGCHGTTICYRLPNQLSRKRVREVL